MNEQECYDKFTKAVVNYSINDYIRCIRMKVKYEKELKRFERMCITDDKKANKLIYLRRIDKLKRKIKRENSEMQSILSFFKRGFFGYPNKMQQRIIDKLQTMTDEEILKIKNIWYFYVPD